MLPLARAWGLAGVCDRFVPFLVCFLSLFAMLGWGRGEKNTCCSGSFIHSANKNLSLVESK